MNPPVLVLGAGGHAKVVMDILRAAGHPIAAVFDDDASKQHQPFYGAQVQGGSADLLPYAQAHGVQWFVAAIGHNATRLAQAQRLQAAGLRAVVAVHPLAVLASSVVLGAGCVVMPGACINASTVLGEHAIVNTGARIDHDCVLAAGVHIGPSATLCGGVSVGEGSLIGVAACVIPGKAIGARVVVGAAAAVINDIANDSCVMGVPARAKGEQ